MVVAFHVPVLIVPKLVKLEFTTVDPRVVELRTDTLFTSYPFPVATFTSPAKFVCPAEFPIFIAVAAPPMFRVVALVLNKFAVTASVIRLPPSIAKLFINAGVVKKRSISSARLFISPATFTGSVDSGYDKE